MLCAHLSHPPKDALNKLILMILVPSQECFQGTSSALLEVCVLDCFFSLSPKIGASNAKLHAGSMCGAMLALVYHLIQPLASGNFMKMPLTIS